MRDRIDVNQLTGLAAAGLCLMEIAAKLGVSKQAVSKRSLRLGVKIAPARPCTKKPRPTPAAVARYGIPLEVILPLIACGATRRFTRQRQSAKQRGIPWELTFAQWWQAWRESGRWEERGRERGKWVMARPGDVGAYSVGNVFICTHSDNCRDAARWRAEKAAIAL